MDFGPFDLRGWGEIGLGSLATFFGVKNWRRKDVKADVIEDSYHEVIESLRQEIQRLKSVVDELVKRVEGCEGERFKLEKAIAAFEARFGTRSTDKKEVT